MFHPIPTPVLKGVWTVRGEEMIFIRLVLSKTHDFFSCFPLLTHGWVMAWNWENPVSYHEIKFVGQTSPMNRMQKIRHSPWKKTPVNHPPMVNYPAVFIIHQWYILYVFLWFSSSSSSSTSPRLDRLACCELGKSLGGTLGTLSGLTGLGRERTAMVLL